MLYNNSMQITIYSTTSCPYCQMLKAYLDEKNFEYDEVLVDQDPQKAQEVIEKSGQMGVPFTIIVDDQNQEHSILGFDKAKLDEIISKA